MHQQATESWVSTAWVPWAKGKLIRQKPPLSLKEIWGIRIRPQIARRVRDPALFNLLAGDAPARRPQSRWRGLVPRLQMDIRTYKRGSSNRWPPLEIASRARWHAT